MLYTVDVRKLPLVTNCYHIERRTVWSAVDPDNILVLVHEGACVFRIESNETTVNKGEAFLIPAGQEYVRRPAPGTSAVFTYLHFRTASPLIETEASRVRSWLEERKTLLTSDAIAEPGAVFEPLDTLCIGTHTRFGGDAEALAGRIAEESVKRHVESGYFASLFLAELLGLLMRTAAAELLSGFDAAPRTPVPPRLREAVLYIHQNLKRTITLADLGRAAGVSPQHVIRLFRTGLGTTPLQYVNRLKIQYAKHLIQFSPSLSMKEIGYELGFENPHYFSRLFTKLAGESPRRFRRRVESYDTGRDGTGAEKTP